MIRPVIILIFIFSSFYLKSQTSYFPPLTGNTWDTISPATLGWCTGKVDTLLNYLQSRNSKAFILLKDGKIVIEKYFGTFTQDSSWYWASAGKTITSFMIGIAQQENFLSINDTTSQYLGQGWTNCTATQEEKITIRHQLTMTSGLDDGVPDHFCTLDTCLNYMADAGMRWAYHNAPYTLLDGVIQNATGQTLNNYSNQKLKIPTGITGAFFQSGYNNVFVSKPRSMARFGLLILNKGNWNGTQIMTDTSYFNQMVNTSQSLNEAYGYLWWLNGKLSFMVPSLQFVFQGPISPSAPGDAIAALGKNGQLINIAPGENLVFIRMGNDPGGGEVPVSFNDTIWQKLNDLMCNTASVESAANQWDNLKIYPNPSIDWSTIELSGQQFDLNIFDYMGRVVFQKQNCFDKTNLFMSGFKSGIYHIQATTGGKTFNQKLVICN